jgi:hypothetical protein
MVGGSARGVVVTAMPSVIEATTAAYLLPLQSRHTPLIIARMPAFTASGSVGQASMTAARSGSASCSTRSVPSPPTSQ